MKKIAAYSVLTALILMPLLISALTSVKCATVDTFVVGEMANPQTFDPAQMYDMASYDVMIQCMEGLYRANTSSDDMEPIPALALNMGAWSIDDLNFTVSLRTDVRFHDGMPFNASCVKWNFDRVLYLFVNDTCSPEYQWKYGDNWILNRTEVVDTYTIKFILNFASRLWIKILTLPSCYIISPISATGYEQTFLTLLDLDVIKGTGPFILDSYTLSQRVVFHSNPNYWRGEPSIKKMVFQIIKDSVTYSQAVLDHTIHYGTTLYSYWSAIDADPTFSTETIPATTAWYLSMNVEQIPRDMRYALANAIDYSIIVDVLKAGYALQLHTPIFQDIQYHNTSIEGLPYYNTTLARKTLLESTDPTIMGAIAAANLDETNTTEEWIEVATNAPLFTYNFTRWNSGILPSLFLVLEYYFSEIGVKLEDVDLGTYDSFAMFAMNPDNYDRMQLTFWGLAPDYNEPTNILEQMYRTDAPLNTMKLNDATLNSMLDQALILDDGPAREYLLWQIQEKIAVDLCPVTMLWQVVTRVTWYNKVLSHVDSLLNPFLLMDLYGCVFTPIEEQIPGFDIVALIGAVVIGMGIVMANKLYKRK